MNKTIISKEETEHIAKLANLKLGEKENELLSEQITEILDFVEKISDVKTDEVDPLANVVGIKNVFREDIVKPSLSQEEALSSAPRSYRGYFKVKAVFENE